MNPVVRTVLQRLGLGIATLFVVSIIISLTIAMLPGDFASTILGQSATPETVAAFQREVGLDRSPVSRYIDWIGGIAHGDFGESYASVGSLVGHRREVAEMIEPRLMNTLFLAGAAALIAVPLALFLGIMAALYRNTLFDRLVNIATLSAISSPDFFLAYILIMFLAVKFPIFVSLANVSPDMSLLDKL
ncbi:MAG TPA: ABC transporter permease, partial [Dongiaceae bacterium]